MQTEFILTRLRNQGKVAKVLQRHISVRGTLTVAETMCEVQRRLVLTATFERTDGGKDPIPPLRDVILRAAKSTGTQTISGVEEIASGALMEPQQFAQSWRLVPAAHEELERAERDIGRLIWRLHTLGIAVQMLPGGGMAIPGETRAEDSAPVRS